jgi:hypothetical protein
LRIIGWYFLGTDWAQAQLPERASSALTVKTPKAVVLMVAPEVK